MTVNHYETRTVRLQEFVKPPRRHWRPSPTDEGAIVRAYVIIAAGLAAIAGSASAESPIYDPEQLPAFHGKVSSYSLTSRDELDGLILEDGTEVHISSRLSSELAFAVKPGDIVTVHGLKATTTALVQALSITNDASGAKILDTFQPSWSPGHPQPPVQPRIMEARGRVKLQLHAFDGRVDGVLLEDGTIVRLAPGFSPPNGDCLLPGRDIVATGTGLVGLLGRVLETRSIALDTETTAPVTPGRTIVILPSGAAAPRAGHLPLINPPAQSKPEQGSPAPQNGPPATSAPNH